MRSRWPPSSPGARRATESPLGAVALRPRSAPDEPARRHRAAVARGRSDRASIAPDHARPRPPAAASRSPHRPRHRRLRRAATPSASSAARSTRLRSQASPPPRNSSNTGPPATWSPHMALPGPSSRTCCYELSRDSGRRPTRSSTKTVQGVEVDFYYPHLQSVIEADGYSFHFTKIAFEDDHERRLYLKANGERVIAVDYAQVTNGRATTANGSGRSSRRAADLCDHGPIRGEVQRASSAEPRARQPPPFSRHRARAQSPSPVADRGGRRARCEAPAGVTAGLGDFGRARCANSVAAGRRATGAATTHSPALDAAVSRRRLSRPRQRQTTRGRRSGGEHARQGQRERGDSLGFLRRRPEA